MTDKNIVNSSQKINNKVLETDVLPSEQEIFTQRTQNRDNENIALQELEELAINEDSDTDEKDQIDDGKPHDDPEFQKAEILNRQITTATATIQNASAPAKVSHSKMTSLASSSEKCIQAFGWLASCLTGILMPLGVMFFGDVMDNNNPNISSEESLNQSIITMIMFIGLGLVIWLCGFLYYTLMIQFGTRVVFTFKKTYLKAILLQEPGWFDMVNYQELNARLGQESTAIQKAMGEKLGLVLFSYSMCISGLIIGFVNGWNFALCVIAGSPIVIITLMFFINAATKGYHAVLRAYGQSAGYAEQALGSIKVVSAFGNEVKEVENYSKYLDKAKTAGLKNQLSGALGFASLLASFYFMYGYSFMIGGYFIREDFINKTFDKVYTPGDILAVFFGVIFGMFALGGVGPALQEVTQGRVAAKSAFDIIDRVPTIRLDEGKKIQVKGEIKFKDVDFFYPSRPDQKILRSFTATFEEGKTTAIVGPSGSGKSTTVQLMERFYDANKGQVLIDGQDIKGLNLRNLRHQIGYVGQEPVLFNTSIKKNMLLGNPQATDDQIIEALKKANAWNFIVKKGMDINMEVGAGGGTLSGGQKQRIALARAFLKKPKVLIFDEATSALDRKNEIAVQNSIDQIRKDLGSVTTVVIAHRLTTVRNADTILVLAKGKLVEQGSHDQLLSQYPNGTYSKFVNEQQNVENQETNKGANEDFDVDVEAKDEDLLPKTDEPIMENKTKSHLAQEEILKEMTNRANDIDAKQQQIDDNLIADLKDEKKMFKSAKKRVAPMAKPNSAIAGAFIFQFITGGLMTSAGVWLIFCMFSMFIPDKDLMWKETTKYCYVFFGLTVVSFIAMSLGKYCFGIVGENITYSIRQLFYKEVLKRNVGWFDNPDYQAGILTTILSSDVQMLNGVSTEAMAAIMKSFSAFFTGLVIALYYCWQISLTAVAIAPCMAIGGYCQQKIEQAGRVGGVTGEGSDSSKRALIMAGDCIANYRTLASFANEDVIIDEYTTYLEQEKKLGLKKAYKVGFVYGFSQFMTNTSFGILFMFGSLFTYIYSENDAEPLDPTHVFLAIFAILFGAMEAANANTFGTDMGKATKAAVKVFSIIGIPSKINPVDIPNDSLKIEKSEFRGEIEFKDVWFRYPQMKQHWVFRGLNLKINSNDQIAIVGQSGQGKSTFINLLMRFYDQTFGEILIDGIDIKKYSIKSLRESMGLVMQEPTLFNYTIRENIIYGNMNASNTEIIEAAEVAAARGFIESDEIQDAIDDNPETLLNAAKKVNMKQMLVDHFGGQEDYKKRIKDLTGLVKQQKLQGKFEAGEDDFDSRSDELKKQSLHLGYNLVCGNKGSKLSGGQKQRIAIARAVIRKPQILLLDEATSALDEESQRLVQGALEKIMVNRTSIIIAHRLSTVEKCNRVAVIQDGKIVEDGSFEDLSNAQEGYFSSLAQGMKQTDQKERLSLTKK